MLKLLTLLISVASAQVVNLNLYLVLPDMPTALARSQTQCQALGCDGVFTKYWWNVIQLTDGTAAVEIHPNGVFGKTIGGIGPCAVGCGLTPAEQAALKTAAQLGSLIPTSNAVTLQ